MREHLDPCFLPLGLQPGRILGGLAYSGTLQGRPIKVAFVRMTQTRYSGKVRYRGYVGYRFEIKTATPLKTRLTVCPVVQGAGGRVLDFIKSRSRSREVKVDKEPYPQFSIWGEDPEWATAVLSDPAAHQEFALLAEMPLLKDNFFLHVHPETVELSSRVHPIIVTPEMSAQVVRSFTQFLDRAEYHPLQYITQPTWFEKHTKKRPILSVVCFFGIALGILFILSLGLMAVAFFLSR